MSDGKISPLGKVVHNRDIAPRETVDRPNIGPLTANETLWDAFQSYERQAVKLSARYSFIGKLCVSLIWVSATYAAFRWVARDMAWYAWYQGVDLIVVVAGVIGLALDIFLRTSDLKRRWLLNRFAAERLRSVKFQAYALAASTRDKVELAERVQDFTRKSIEALIQETRFPSAALNKFDPVKALQVPDEQGADAPEAGANTEILKEAIDDFRRWRTEYQHDFANNMKGEIVSRSRVYTSLSDGLFFIGALAVVVTLVARFIIENATNSALPSGTFDWMEAVGIALFVSTAIASKLSSGAANTLNESRYQQYERDTARLLENEPTNSAEFVQRVHDMEFLALRELDDFWRDIWISSYL